MSKSRDYQIDTKVQIRSLIGSGLKRIITQLPTGSGKTFTFIDIANDAMKKGNKIIIVIRRRSLIFQTAKSFENFTGHKPGVVMGSQKLDLENPVQIVSIDTINRRMNKPEYQFLIDFDILICDECHDSTSKKYSSFLDLFPNKFWLGFTATCLPTGKKYLADVGWEEVIVPITAIELRDRGYLSPEITYAPKKIDVSGIKTVAGDYDQKALAERAMSSAIIGDTVEVYKTHGQNRPALGFGVNIEHSKMLAEGYRQAGIPALHIDASHNQEEREAAIEKLYTGEIKILWSVGVFSTGTDVPIASCLVYARPTKSEILYIQQVGRVLRPYKNCANCGARLGADPECHRCGSTHFTNIKENAIIIDQANNCERFGLAYDQRFPRLRAPDKKKKKTELEDDFKTKTCDECYGVYSIDNSQCPYCGHENAKTKREIEQEEGELERKRSEDLRYSRMIKIKNDLMRLSNPRWKPSAKWTMLHNIYGDDIYEFKKELEMPVWVRGQISRNKKGQSNSTRRL